MPAPTTSSEITIGVIGSGVADDRAITALLEDYFQDKVPTLVVPVTKTHYTDALDVTLAYAEDNDVPLLAITDGTTARSKSFRTIAESAEKQYKTDNVAAKLVEVLASVDTPAQLFLLWSEDSASDTDAMLALEAATAKGIPAFDLCDGLTPLGFDSPEVDPEDVAAPAAVLEDEAESTDEAEAEAPRSRRGRKDAAAEPQTDAAPPRRRGRRASAPAPVEDAPEATEDVEPSADEESEPQSLEEEISRAAGKADLVAGTVPDGAPLRPEVADSLARVVYMLAAELSAHVVARMKAEQLVTPKRPPGRPAKA